MSTATICDKCQKTISIGNQNQSQIINLEKSAFIGGQHEYFHICPACYKSLKEWLVDKAQSGEIATKPEVSTELLKMVVEIAPTTDDGLKEIYKKLLDAHFELLKKHIHPIAPPSGATNNYSNCKN